MAEKQTVVVGLCHPHGITFLLEDGAKRFTIKGNAEELRGKEGGVLPEEGYGYTENVDAELWKAIKAKYGNLAIFKHELCFDEPTLERAKARAKELAEKRHGREPIKIDGSDKTVKTQAAKA